MTGFPLVLKIERAVTENFDFRFGSGVVELTKEHSSMAIRAPPGEEPGVGKPYLLIRISRR